MEGTQHGRTHKKTAPGFPWAERSSLKIRFSFQPADGLGTLNGPKQLEVRSDESGNTNRILFR